MAINTTSSTLTPQAGDDTYSTTEDYLTGGNVLILDVMSNDLGGKAKVLWSIDDGCGNPMDPANLLGSDIGDSCETTANGNHIRIVSGHIEYELGNADAVNALAEGEVMHDTFTYAIRLANGTLSLATVHVDIVGSNDAAVITGTATDSVTEASGVLNGTPGDATASGNLDATDVDSSALFVVQSGVASTYGTFSIDNTGAWSYTLDDANGAVQALNTGSTPLHDLITVATADGTTQQIDVTINGANDAAVITGTATDSVTEASGVLNGTPGDASASGDLNATDVDSSALFAVQTGVASTYGTFSIDNTGAWNYTVNDANGAVQGLNTSSTPLHDLITVATADGTAQVIDVTINGANDNAVITGTATDSVTEASSGNGGGTPTATGDLLATDVDNPTDLFQAVTTATTSANSYGAFTVTAGGVWTYTLDNSNSTVNALNNGQSLSDSFTVYSDDGTAKTVNITINGANDAAVITGTATDSVTEASGVLNTTPGDASASGDLNATDVDSSALFAVQTGVASTYGTFSIDNTGAWNYTVNDANGAVQALNTSSTPLHDLITVATADGTTQVIDVTINGANDAAVITGTATDSVTEASGVLNTTPGDASASGDLNATDVDSSALFAVQTGVASTYGTARSAGALHRRLRQFCKDQATFVDSLLSCPDYNQLADRVGSIREQARSHNRH